MAFELANFADDQLDVDYLTYLIDQQLVQSAQHHRRLWDYFRNPIIPALAGTSTPGSRLYAQAQEEGLPPRITGMDRLGAEHDGLCRKEIVVENDIAWRIHTMIDFLFGQAPSIRSKAADPALAGCIEQLIAAILDANGGVSFFQEMTLLGSVYGFVDVAFRIPAISPATGLPMPATSNAGAMPVEPASASTSAPGTSNAEDTTAGNVSQDPRGDRFRRFLHRSLAAARSIILETVEAPRVLPILDENNFRQVRYWIQRLYKYPSRMENRPWSWRNLLGASREQSPAVVEVVEILSANWWQRYEDRVLVAEGPNPLSQLPVVHIQNIPLPLSYEGLSDVEPLVPLQDELNTRLSDRANRVTFQAFKMYLGKGIEGFLERPVGPGQMWTTSNLQATVEEFGSDNGSPSEDAHIEQVRAAMDKVSAVPPLAAGLLRGNVGNLTSATALKVLLGGLLARTEKKRLSYGGGIARMVELALAWMDKTGLFPTSPADRQIEIHWPNPLPVDEGEQLRNAQIKAQLGLPTERILAELGYDRKPEQGL